MTEERFQEKTLTSLSELQTRLSYQQAELTRIAQVLNADGDRSLVTRLHLLERDMKNLESSAKDQAAWGKQIKLAIVVSLLGLLSPVGVPLLLPHLKSAPEPSPSPDWFDPGSGES